MPATCQAGGFLFQLKRGKPHDPTRKPASEVGTLRDHRLWSLISQFVAQFHPAIQGPTLQGHSWLEMGVQRMS